MIITDAKETKKKRIAVYIDDEYAISIDRLLWDKNKLKIGASITAGELNAISKENNYEKAKTKALNMLSQKSYTGSDLKKKLAAKLDEQSAKDAVDRMEQLGLINDTSYCREYIQYLYEVKKYGKRRILSELKEKGIDRFIIEDEMELFCFDDDFERALRLAQKKYPTPKEKDRNKVYSFLIRCGYDYSVIKEVMESLFSVEESDYEL